MRENAPVLRTKTALGDAWYLSRHRDVVQVLRAPKIFSSELYDPKKAPQVLFMDEPDHTRLRAAVATFFTPKAVARLEGRIRELAGKYFAPILSSGVAEVMEGFAAPLTMDMITSLLGLPLSDTEKFRRWSQDWVNYSGRLTGNSPGSPTDEAGTMAFADYITKALEKIPPDGDSILSNLVRCRAEGTMTEQEAKFFSHVLFTAGHETTMILIANGMAQLAEMPHLLARLRDNPRDVPAFVEEMARFKPPIHRLRRITTQETEISGHTIPARSHVRLLIVSANHDPEKFPEPDVFNIDRDTGGHLGFGFGVHSCLGSWLARLETRIVFELIAEKVSRIEFYPDPTRAAVPFTGGSMANSGPKALTLRLIR
jgi:cytochrome P450